MEFRYKIVLSAIVFLLILSTGISQMSSVTASVAGPRLPLPPRTPSFLLLDSDSDGLLNTWETTGIDINGDGRIDYNLRAKGANPTHKDIFVEVDFMEFHRPNAQAITNVINSFARAPVSNPDGTTGIRLHVLVDEQIPHQDTINDYEGLATIKKSKFGTFAERNTDIISPASIIAAKKLAYHYGLFAHSRAGTTSSGLAEGPGNDFIVSLGSTGWGTVGSPPHTVGSLDQQEGTFMHEFGHNLNLKHGGGDNINNKPNYLSVMNYLFQMSSTVADRPLDYSRCSVRNVLGPMSTAGTLNENILVESIGIGRSCPPGLQTFINAMNLLVLTRTPIDYNRDGDTADPDVERDLTGDSKLSPRLSPYSDWSTILYNFRTVPEGASGAPAAGATPSEFGRPLSATTSEPEYSVENLRQDRLKLLAGIEQAIQTLPPTAFRTPEAAGVAKGNLSAEIRTAPTESITALLNANNLNGAIQELNELKARADSSMGGAAADDLIAAPQAQQQVTFLINNMIQALEKQK